MKKGEKLNSNFISAISVIVSYALCGDVKVAKAKNHIDIISTLFSLQFRLSDFTFYRTKHTNQSFSSWINGRARIRQLILNRMICITCHSTLCIRVVELLEKPQALIAHRSVKSTPIMATKY